MSNDGLNLPAMPISHATADYSCEIRAALASEKWSEAEEYRRREANDRDYYYRAERGWGF